MTMTTTTGLDPQVRRRDPTGVRADILRVATAEFVEKGFGGARIDEIAARTHTTKRMIYYYFDSKEGLFTSVMDRSFDEFWRQQSMLDVNELDPLAALRHFAEISFDAFMANADFVRLLAVENSRAADHFATRAARNPPASGPFDVVPGILARGLAAGVFRSDIDAIDIRLLIVSYASFRTVFRSTVSNVFGRDMLNPERLSFYRKLAGDMIVATMTSIPDEC